MYTQKQKKGEMFHVLCSTFHNSRGFGLIEILIASAIVSASLITLTATSQIAFRLTKESVERTQAGFLAEEAVEVTRVLRDASWSSYIAPLSPAVAYYPSFSATTSAWSFSTSTPSFIYGIFDRTVIFDDVYRRDADGEIVPPDSPDPKTIDPDTKKITARVEWGQGKNISVATYFTNLFQN